MSGDEGFFARDTMRSFIRRVSTGQRVLDAPMEGELKTCRQELAALNARLTQAEEKSRKIARALRICESFSTDHIYYPAEPLPAGHIALPTFEDLVDEPGSWPRAPQFVFADPAFDADDADFAQEILEEVNPALIVRRPRKAPEMPPSNAWLRWYKELAKPKIVQDITEIQSVTNGTDDDDFLTPSQQAKFEHDYANVLRVYPGHNYENFYQVLWLVGFPELVLAYELQEMRLSNEMYLMPRHAQGGAAKKRKRVTETRKRRSVSRPKYRR